MKGVSRKNTYEIYRFVLICIFCIVIGIVSYSYVKGSNYTFSETEDKVYNTLLAAGFSKAGACGILGNMAVENPKFEADLYGNGGITYGLFQWNNVGDRKDSLVRWCNNRLLYPNRIDGQLAFAIHEIEGGDPIAKRLEKFLKTTDNPREAAMEFSVGFERCVGSTSNPDMDAKYEGSIYPEYYGKTYQAMAERMAMAEHYYNGYIGERTDPSLVFIVDATPTPGLVSEIEDKIHIDIQRSLNMKIDASVVNDPTSIFILRVVCVLIGYICGSIYVYRFLIDKNKLNPNHLKTLNEIPHPRSVMSQFGIKKASYVFAGDILKLILAVNITVFFVKGLPHDETILYTGLGVVIGNAFPFWNRFKGGIGLTVTILTLILYMPIWGVLCCIIGLYLAKVLQSFTLGIVVMSVLMIPFAYHYKDTIDAIIVSLILVLLIISHQRVLLRYFDKKVLRNHYHKRRNQYRINNNA